MIGRDRSSDVLLLEPSPYGAIEYILFIFLFNILIVKDQVTNIILFIVHATRNSGHGWEEEEAEEEVVVVEEEEAEEEENEEEVEVKPWLLKLIFFLGTLWVALRDRPFSALWGDQVIAAIRMQVTYGHFMETVQKKS